MSSQNENQSASQLSESAGIGSEGTRSVEPDPQRDGGLPWTRADEEQMLAIADYYEGELA